MCQNPASVPHVLREHVNVGSQDSHAVYSVDVQIMRIKDVKISTRPKDNINFTYHVVYFIMRQLYLFIILLCLIIMYIFQLLYNIHINNIVLLYGFKILKGKMGEHIAKLLLANDLKPMVKASK